MKQFPTEVLTLILLMSCTQVQLGPLTDPRGQVIYRELLPHSRDQTKKVELFWTKPERDGPWPAIIFIHGHQIGTRNGGEMYVKNGDLRGMARRGYVAASVSQPGYGNSTGSPDYCGPFTQEAILVAIDWLRQLPLIYPEKIALHGTSRGAIAAAMVATRDARLAAVVLVAGAYDFAAFLPKMDQGVRTNFWLEAGTSADAFKPRSALYHVDKIKSPILLLHGTQDATIRIDQASRFFERLQAAGASVRLRIFPGYGHGIPGSVQFKEWGPFVEEYLRSR